MTQWLIEEAAFAALEVSEHLAAEKTRTDVAQESRLEDMARRAMGQH